MVNVGNAWDVVKGIPVFGAVGYGAEYFYNLATGKKDPLPQAPDNPGTNLDKTLTEGAGKTLEEGGQKLKEEGEKLWNGLTGTYDKIKKYGPLAVAGVAGLLILKAVKK